MLRLLLRILLFLALLAVIIVPAFIIGGGNVPRNGLKWGTHWGLNWIDAPPLSFDVTALALDFVEYSNLRFGGPDGPRIDKLRVYFDTDGLQRYEIREIAVTGIRAAINWSDRGPEIVGFSDWLAYLTADRGQSKGGADLSIKTLTYQIETIRIRGNGLTADVSGAGSGRIGGGGMIDFSNDLTIAGRGHGFQAELAAALALSVDGTGTALSARISDGRIHGPQMNADGLRGQASLAMGPDDASAKPIFALVDMSLDGLTAFGQDVGAVSATAALEQDRASISLGRSNQVIFAAGADMTSDEVWPYHLTVHLDENLWPLIAEASGEDTLAEVGGQALLSLKGRLAPDILNGPLTLGSIHQISSVGSAKADMTYRQSHLRGRLGIAVGAGQVGIEVVDQIDLEIREAEVTGPLADALALDPDAPLHVAVAPGSAAILDGGGKLRLDLTPSATFGPIGLTGSTRIETGAADWMDGHQGGLDLSNTAFDLSNLSYGGHKVDLRQISIAGRIQPGATALDYRTLASFVPDGDTAVAARGKTALSGGLRQNGKTWEIELNEGRFDALNLNLSQPGIALTPEGSSLSAQFYFGPTGKDTEVSGKATLRARTLTVERDRDGESQTAVVDMPHATVELGGTAARLEAVVGVTARKLAAADVPIDVRGLSAGGSVILRDLTPSDFEVDARIGSVADHQVPPRFSEASLFAKARSQGMDALTFESGIALNDKDLGLWIDGQMALDGNREGRATLRSSRFLFEPGILEPEDISPAYGGLLNDAWGMIALNGEVTWEGPDFATADMTDVTLAMEDISFAGGFGSVSGLTAIINLDSLRPVSTAGPQLISARRVFIGAPLDELSLAVAIDRDGMVRLNDFSGKAAGGVVSAADMAFSTSAEKIEIPLRIQGVKLNDLGQIAKIGGLALSGGISGTVPLEWTKARGFRIRKGRLSTDGGGIVAYRPEPVPAAFESAGDKVSLMLNALRDFRYDDLVLEAEGAPLEEFRIGMRLSGSNPDLYDGYPLEFNLSLSGRLDELLRANLRNQQLPERIEEMLRLQRK